MNTQLIALALLLVSPLFAPLRAADVPIDWDRAQQLHNRAARGEQLTPEEQADYDRARAARKKGQPQATKLPAPAKWTTHLTPLTELGEGNYKGQDGGLYGGGRNEPPKLHLETAMREAAKIQPLDADGQPSPEGRIVLLCVGMSNTTMEFSRFKQIADADPAKSPRVILVDGAQGGKDARITADPEAQYWKIIDDRIRKAGVTPKQVQAIWFKQAIISPRQEFPAEAKLNYDPARGEVKAPLLLWGPYLWADGATPRKADGFNYTIDDVVERDRTHPSKSGQQKVAALLLKFFQAEPTAKWFAKSS